MQRSATRSALQRTPAFPSRKTRDAIITLPASISGFSRGKGGLMPRFASRAAYQLTGGRLAAYA